jgi:hypothetical protein
MSSPSLTQSGKLNTVYRSPDDSQKYVTQAAMYNKQPGQEVLQESLDSVGDSETRNSG